MPWYVVITLEEVSIPNSPARSSTWIYCFSLPKKEMCCSRSVFLNNTGAVDIVWAPGESQKIFVWLGPCKFKIWSLRV